jgi:hypothetical protein
MYARLVRISHWTAKEIAREQALSEEAKNVRHIFRFRIMAQKQLSLSDAYSRPSAVLTTLFVTNACIVSRMTSTTAGMNTGRFRKDRKADR